MPTKYRSLMADKATAARAAHTAQQQQLVALEIEKVIAPIAAVAKQIVERQATSAWRMAKERAPVRRVFARDVGGKLRRIQTRKMTIAELRGETPAFIRSLTGEDRAIARKFQIEGVPTSRFGTRTVMGRNTNRANRWAATGLSRQTEFVGSYKLKHIHGHLVGVPDVGTFRLADLEAAARLNKEGRASLRQARLDVITVGGRKQVHDIGRGGLSVSPVERINPETKRIEVTGFDVRLGGNLRRSIEMIDTSRGDHIEQSVKAGGPTAPYAKYMEFGTRYVAERPFLRPALKHVEVVFSQRLRQALRQAGLL